MRTIKQKTILSISVILMAISINIILSNFIPDFGDRLLLSVFVIAFILGLVKIVVDVVMFFFEDAPLLLVYVIYFFVLGLIGWYYFSSHGFGF